MQYYLFPQTELEQLRQDCAELRRGHHHMRRGLFARHNELERKLTMLQDEVNEYKQIAARKKAELVPFFGEYFEVTK